MSYFQHHYASNSDLKEIVNRHEGRQKPENISAIYDFGTEFHAGILEPHKADWTKVSAEQKLLIEAMAKTFWKDNLCRNFAMVSDFRREHEFYRINRFGLAGVRCKVDGESRKLNTILELKGLGVSTQKAFEDSLLHLDYDQGAAWYIDVASGFIQYKQKLVVAISKEYEDRLFKVLIDRNHPYYKSGKNKIEKAIGIWKMYGLR